MRLNSKIKNFDDLRKELDSRNQPYEKDKLLLEIFLDEKYAVFMDEDQQYPEYMSVSFLFSDPEKKLKNVSILFNCTEKTLKLTDGTLPDGSPFCDMEYSDLCKAWYAICLIPKPVRLQLFFYTIEPHRNRSTPIFNPPILVMPNAEPQPWFELDNTGKEGAIIPSHTKTEGVLKTGFPIFSSLLALALAVKGKISLKQGVALSLSSILLTQFVDYATTPRHDFSVYLPKNYDSERTRPYSLMVCLDGEAFLKEDMDLKRILDNLIYAGKISETVVIFLNSYPDEYERYREYGCNNEFMTYLSKNLLPEVRAKYRVTSEPQNTTIVGISMGGLSAVYAGLFFPHVFGNVISLSGSLWWHPDSSLVPRKSNVKLENIRTGNFRQNWLIENCPQPTRGRSKFYLAVGSYEIFNSLNLLESNKGMVEKLKEVGYDASFREFRGNHSAIDWRGPLSDGLAYLLRTTLCLAGNQAAAFNDADIKRTSPISATQLTATLQ